MHSHNGWPRRFPQTLHIEDSTMDREAITFFPIGTIHSEHTAAPATPIQPAYAADCRGHVEVYPEFAAGLKDLAGFSHIYLLYQFHRAEAARLSVKPFLEDVERGIFATRAPCRPNAIGLSVVELIDIDGAVLHVAGIDILDGTPLIDIKPYTAKFDRVETIRNGWQDGITDEAAARRGRRDYRGPATTASR